MKCNYSAGIGLIEVLVTSVVISVGLLAVASLQGDLMGGSRVNKTRAECQSLASTKIEQLRDSIVLTGYNALIANPKNPPNPPTPYTDAPIAGVTETFTRSWVVADQTNPVSKRISVTVSWGSPSSIENQCAVQSVIAFDGIGNSLLAAKGAGGATTSSGTSSLNANASTNITEYVTLKTSLSTKSAGSVVNQDRKDYIVDPTGLKGAGTVPCSEYTTFENNLLTRRVDYDRVDGDEAIELVEKVTVGTVDYCIPRIRYNGGVIIPINGIVHYAPTATGSKGITDFNLFTFSASESGYFCVFKPNTLSKSAPYVCYVGGNCKNFSGTPVLIGSVTECQNSYSAVTVGEGGWRGKVGLLGITLPPEKSVCFGEEIINEPVTLDTARNYYSRNGLLNQGINKSYNCHDFLIIDGQAGNAKNVHDECVKQAGNIGGLVLASKNIWRDISGSNLFDSAVDINSCSGDVIYGALSNADATTVITVNNGTCTASANSYSCKITKIPTPITVSIVATYNGGTINTTCNLPATSSGCPISFPPPASTSLYNITGNIAAPNSTDLGTVSLSLSNSGTCTISPTPVLGNYPYSCSVNVVPNSIVTLTASASIGGLLTIHPSSGPELINKPTSITTTTTPLPGPNYTVTHEDTYIISGSIYIGVGVKNTATNTNVNVTVAANNRGSCNLYGNHAASSTDTYTCKVLSNSATTLTLAVSPLCSSKYFELQFGSASVKNTNLTSGSNGTLSKTFLITYSPLTVQDFNIQTGSKC